MREKQNERPIPGCKVMSKDGFWNLIAEVRVACGQDEEKYMDTLIAHLKELGPKYAKDFHDIVHAYEDLAYKYGLWSAAGLISYTSDDSFIDFRAWLISQGKKAYYAVLKDPDTLADLNSGDGYWFESFTYAGYFALEELTGEDAYASYDKAAHENIVRALKADIKYAEWINYPFMPSETSEYYPRLYEKYMARSEQLRLAGSVFWNLNNRAIAEARQAGPPPKPQNTMEMGGM
ncbi:DUF4240 domain-containing protein [Acutalibacter muris]|uniref:DUF4240 domain-containing protein n=1 Tax=Acutalibacter muris TaxID=1796620 RepID=UPI001C3F1382|nr:DUF4240 domain-containing protein [Acutalibacter muris]